MSAHKYAKFYLLNDGKKHDIRILQKMSDERYLQKYDGNMYCPLCRKAQLSRVRRGKNVFLRTNPRQAHGMNDNEEPCKYAFDRKTNIEVKKIITDLKDSKKLNDKLKSIMLQLKKRMTKKEVIDPEQEDKRSDKIESKSKGVRNGTRYIIPQYSFLNWGEKTPQNQLLIAKGCVYVKNRKSKEGYDYIHIFEDMTKRKSRTSFRKPADRDIDDGYYYIVAIGICKQKVTEKHIYYDFYLDDCHDGLLIEAVSMT